jgi:hypothetical protein
MSPLRFDMLIIAVIAAGAVIAGVHLFMLAVPRNDDEHLHDGATRRSRASDVRRSTHS